MILLLKTLKYLAICLLLVILLLAGTLAMVLSTPIGSDWMLAQVRSLTGDSLQLGASDGALNQGLVLYDLRYESSAGTLVLDELELQWQPFSLFSGVLRVDYLAVRGGQWLPAEQPDQQPAPQPEQGFSWPSLSVPLAVELPQLELSGWRGVAAAEGASLQASLSLEAGELRVDRFSLSSPIANADISGELALTPPYSMNLRASWDYALDNGQRLAGQSQLFGNLNGMELDNSLTSPVAVQSSGSLRLQDWQTGTVRDWQNLRFSLQHRLQQYALPLAGGQLALGQLLLQTDGQPDQVQIDLQAGLEFQGHPLAATGQLALQASLQQMQQITLQALQLDSDRGRVTAEGQLNWQQGLQWQASLSGSNLQLVEPVSSLNGQLQLTGSMQDELVLTVDIDTIEALLEGVVWNLSGQANLQGDQLRLADFRADSGGQQLQLSGQVWPQPNFSFSATASEVSNLLPGVEAQVQGQGQLTGEWNNPRGNLELEVNRLRAGDTRLEHAQLQLQPLPGQQRYAVQLQMGPLYQADNQLLLQMLVQGELDSSRASLDLSAGLPQGELAASVQLQYPDVQQGLPDDPRLQLRLQSLAFSGLADWPDLQLQQASLAQFDRRSQRLSSTCIELGGGGEVCIQAERQRLDAGTGWTGSLQASGLPAALANPWLPPDLQWTGLLSARADLSSQPGQPLSLSAGVDGESGEIRLRALGDGVEPLIYRDFTASVQALGARWSGSASAQLPGDSPLQAQASYNSDSEEIDAHLDLTLSQLRWLEGVSTRIEQPDGRAELRLQVAGSAQQPRFDLFLHMQQLQGMLVDTGVQISDSWLRLQPANGDNRQYALQGRLNTGQGGADIDGQIGLTDLSNPALQLTLDGENLQLFDRPDFTAWVSPQLTLDWRDGAGRVDGLIEMPTANLQMPKVAGASLRRSSDEIIVGQVGRDEPKGRMSGRIRVVIGDRVRLSGQGLDTGLSGELEAEYAENGDLALYGTLTISDGEYRAYGRVLDIENGSLTFSGEAGNPGISIRAVQTYPEYQVGIQITGTAQNPVTELFSSPDMPQTDILAILVTGRRLDRIGEGEAPSLLDAIDSLGIVGGESLTGRIESAFGLSEFRITDEEEGNSVVAGKFILPRLYVELVQSLFDRTSKLGLEYLVNDNLRVRAQSGDAQSMELIYVIERP